MLSTLRMHYPKLKLPVRFYLAGCSQSGKSSLLKAMIENMEALFERPFTRIIIARRAVDELHLQLQRAYPHLVELVMGMPMEFLDSIEEQVRPGDNILLIFDDLISIVAESREAENAFYVSSSKFGVSIVLTSQNIFHRSAKLRNISLNCNLIGLTQNLRDATQVASIARQLYPENPEFLLDAYRKTMRLKPFNYLLINLHPLCDFNSGRFDMTLIRPWLIPYLQEQQPNTIRPIKKGGSNYLALATNRLRFLDVSNYLAPFTSYEGWVSAYTKGRHAKGIFCYEYLTRPSQLLERQLPPREAFDSSLKGTRCSEEQYAEVQRVWKKHQMQTLGDYLRYYNLLDVVPFVKALENMRAFWREQGHDMFHKVCTLPGLADRFVRKNFSRFARVKTYIVRLRHVCKHDS